MTVADINEVIGGRPAVLRAPIVKAAFELSVERKLVGVSVGWRELLADYRRWIVTSGLTALEVRTPAGSFKQRALVDQDGDARRVTPRSEPLRFPSLVGALEGLHLAILAAETFDPADFDAAAVRSRVMKSYSTMAKSRGSIYGTHIEAAFEAVQKRHGLDKLNASPLSWTIDRIRLEMERSRKETPADNTIRPVLERLLPDHPKVLKKKFKKAGG